MEKEMAQFAFRFLEDNKIDLETADVIELTEIIKPAANNAYKACRQSFDD